LEDSSSVFEQTQKPTEFDAIGRFDADSLTIHTFDSDAMTEGEFRQLLEKRIARAIDPVAKSILGGTKSSNTGQIDAVMKNIQSKIPSTKISQYFRAGKNYYTINHKFGHAGNLFFKSVFDDLLKENQGCYITTQENSICIICRT
jgi:hypothetical protein